MTINERIEEQSFCYDPDFPPDVAEGLPLVAPAKPGERSSAPVRRALRACGSAATALTKRRRSS
jgi:hypothetical protein